MIQNPIIPGFNPDPSICRVGEDYYIATSTFEWFPGVQIHHSKDLMNWRLLTHALKEKRLLGLQGVPSSGGVWAPALSFCDGLFYLCYTVVHQHESATKDTPNYLTTATSVEGPWSDPVYVNSSGFDPSLFHDDDGKKYWLNMVWDHRSGHHPFYGIALQEYDYNKKLLVGEPKIIFKGSSIGLTEGPHLYKRNGFYYLMTAEGGTGYEHAVTLARSEKLDGPYELHPENPILTSAEDESLVLQKAGHASLVETTKGEWYMAHLCGRPLPGTRRCNMGRETALQKVEWRENDWLYLQPQGNAPQQKVTQPDLPSHPWPDLPSRLPFDSPHYASPRIKGDLIIVEDQRLILKGGESLESNFEQALYGRRLTSQRMIATTKMRFKPDSFQQMAGLVLYYNTFLFHYLYLSFDEKKGLCLHLHSCDDGQSVFTLESNPVVVESRELFLRATLSGAELQFSWSYQDGDYQNIGPVLDASILSDDYGTRWGFTGTFVGVACQDLTGNNMTAEFEYLEIK